MTKTTALLSEAKGVADGLQFACRLPDKKPDFFACGGPAAEAYWEYFTPARIVSLLAAIEALSSALRTHQIKITDAKGEFCAGCLEPSCPDPEAIIAGALTGKGTTDD